MNESFDLVNRIRSRILGGAREVRTPGLRSAIAALSQLSYGPISCLQRRSAHGSFGKLVMRDGFEPPTHGTNRCSTAGDFTGPWFVIPL